MRRRLFLHAGSAASVAVLAACGGGGGGVERSAQLPLGNDPQPDAASAGTPTNTAAEHKPALRSSALPAQVLGCYYTAWSTGAHPITDIPSEFNVIYLFHATPDGAPVNGHHNNVGDGSFVFNYYDNISADQVQACRQRGQKMILTVGGAQNGYAWDNRTKSRNFVESVKTMYARLGGFDGLDFNNYEATIVNRSNVDAVLAEMIWIAGQMKSMYGSEFAITSPPQPTSPEQQKMMAEMAKAGVLDYAGPQFYDWSGFNAPGFIKGNIDQWVTMMADPQKVVVGLSGNYDNGPSLDDCMREWDAIRKAHPNIRGMFCWSAQHVMAGGNHWSKTMRARM